MAINQPILKNGLTIIESRPEEDALAITQSRPEEDTMARTQSRPENVLAIIQHVL